MFLPLRNINVQTMKGSSWCVGRGRFFSGYYCFFSLSKVCTLQLDTSEELSYLLHSYNVNIVKDLTCSVHISSLNFPKNDRIFSSLTFLTRHSYNRQKINVFGTDYMSLFRRITLYAILITSLCYF